MAPYSKIIECVIQVHQVLGAVFLEGTFQNSNELNVRSGLSLYPVYLGTKSTHFWEIPIAS